MRPPISSIPRWIRELVRKPCEGRIDGSLASMWTEDDCSLGFGCWKTCRRWVAGSGTDQHHLSACADGSDHTQIALRRDAGYTSNSAGNAPLSEIPSPLLTCIPGSSESDLRHAVLAAEPGAPDLRRDRRRVCLRHAHRRVAGYAALRRLTRPTVAGASRAGFRQD